MEKETETCHCFYCGTIFLRPMRKAGEHAGRFYRLCNDCYSTGN